MNGFTECLTQSHAASDLPLWMEIYQQAFPTLVTTADHRKDGTHQRAGIDRSIILEEGKRIWVDEKIRGRNKITNRVYGDIALEHISNNRTKAPGWVCKPLLCDFIAYAIGPLGKAYLLPVIQLQTAWRENGSTWQSRYGNREAINQGYETIFTPVPVAPLFAAIGQALRVQFEAYEFTDGDLK